jgi:hypothetical protein
LYNLCAKEERVNEWFTFLFVKLGIKLGTNKNIVYTKQKYLEAKNISKYVRKKQKLNQRARKS